MTEKAFEQYGFAGGVAVVLLFAFGIVGRWLFTALDRKDTLLQEQHKVAMELTSRVVAVIEKFIASNESLGHDIKANTASNKELVDQIRELARIQSDLFANQKR